MAIKPLFKEDARLPFPKDQVIHLEIEASPEARQKLINLLGCVSWATMVGHSATFAASFDGDGADFVRIKGLPKGDYKEMGEALSSYGGTFEEVGLNSATCVNVQNCACGERTELKRKTVWPPEEQGAD